MNNKYIKGIIQSTRILTVLAIIGFVLVSSVVHKITHADVVSTNNFSVMGIVSEITSNSISVSDAKSSDGTDKTSYTVSTEMVTKIENKSYVPLTLADISKGDKIVMQGIERDEQITIKRIISFSKAVIATTTATTTESVATTTASTTATTTESVASTTPDAIGNSSGSQSATSTSIETPKSESASSTATTTEVVATSTAPVATSTEPQATSTPPTVTPPADNTVSSSTPGVEPTPEVAPVTPPASEVVTPDPAPAPVVTPEVPATTPPPAAPETAPAPVVTTSTE